jgi:GTP-binding protein
MKISKAEFTISAVGPKQYPEATEPEIALVGRSNVGKSSLINKFVNRKSLARTSSQPGKTQTLNFYRIWPEGKPKLGDPKAPDEKTDRFTLQGAAREAAQQSGAFYFVDMPGYGFAKVSESQRRQWQRLIEQYLTERPTLRAVIQVVDLRHPPSRDDLAMWDWLRHHGKVRLCLATKADKIGRTRVPAHLKEIRNGLSLTAAESLLHFSAEEGTGRDELWRWVAEAIQ